MKEILIVEEEDSYVNTDEVLKSCVYITVAVNRFICAVPNEYLTLLKI